MNRLTLNLDKNQHLRIEVGGTHVGSIYTDDSGEATVYSSSSGGFANIAPPDPDAELQPGYDELLAIARDLSKSNPYVKIGSYSYCFHCLASVTGSDDHLATCTFRRAGIMRRKLERTR